MDLLTRFKTHLQSEFPFLEGKKLLIACSGGIDSVVLVHLLAELKLNFALAHCNFSLRGRESDLDEAFVIGLAKRLDVSVFAETFDTIGYSKEKKISVQMAARELRYTWFNHLLQNFNFDFLLTAHHLDDDLETFLIHLSRGTGLDGLLGIPVSNDKILRPLLEFSKEEIEEYAVDKNLKWREDLTNLDSDYLRNKIRLEVIPAYKETHSDLLKSFKKTQNHLRSAASLIEDYMVLIRKLVLQETEDGLRIDITVLQNLPHPKELLYELLKDFGFTQWDDVFQLLTSQSGKKVYSKTHRLLKNREELLLASILEEDEEEIYLVSEKGIEDPIKLRIEKVKEMNIQSPFRIYVDADKLEFPLLLRRWREGDYFFPFGMKGRKKLSKFFKDEKLSIAEKEKIWVLCDGDRVLWIVDYRMDNRFRIQPSTKEILQITHELERPKF